MKSLSLLLLAATLLLMPSPGFGLGMEQFGSALEQGHPTVEQPGWPAGMIRVVDHNSRIYSMWVNGGEGFYFKANHREVLELVRLFSEMRLRDHVVTIKPGPLRTKSFHGEQIVCNVTLEHLGGIVGAARREGDEAMTFDPALVIYVDPESNSDWWKEADLPDHLCIHSEVEGWPVANTVKPPERKLFFARLAFEHAQPKLDFLVWRRVSVTLWDDAEKPGIPLSDVNPQGEFRVAFSEEELTQLKSGKMWLTLTVGDHRVQARPGDRRLDATYLARELEQAKVLELAEQR